MEAEDRPLAIVDIDGVVADVRHRLHHLEGRRKDWDAFFAAAVDDPPYEEGLAIVAELAEDHEVVFLTGRPERCRADTELWFEANGMAGHRLFMRPEGTRRPAAHVKRELLDRLAEGREVAVIVDDDPLVIAAMRSAGRPTFHATWGERSATLHQAQEVEGRS
ncbi:MAG: hypothetical protein WD232_09965 [Acidimicrobiales bacterium]